jgi:2-furoyl-CoA dehydrogenase large subunit
MTEAAKFVGQPIERKEDARLLTGNATFADHYPVRPGTLHAAVLRSPYAHAEILSIDASAALALPGVSHVLTGADIRALSDPFLMVLKLPLDEWALAGDRVRFAGEAVALVLATDRYVAEDALELIVVEYRGLETVVDPDAAVLDDTVLIHEDAGSNVVSERSFSYGEPEAAFAAAEHRFSITIDYPRNSLTPIEGFVVVADYDAENDLFDILSNFQGPYTGHPVMARSLRVPESGVRLRTPACSGGSFGVKQAVLPYIILMAVAARHSGKTVKWVEDRLEHLSAATAAPNRKVRLDAAVEADGKITALDWNQLDDYGAYLRSPMPGPLYRMHGCMSGAYDIANLRVTNRLVLTNKTPAGLVRGFGGPQMYYALERLMQRIAIQLNLDPLDVIRRNLIASGSFPYRAAAGALYDSGDYQLAVATATEEGGLEELLRRRDAARAEGRKYGIGYAAVVEPSMSNMGYLSTITPAETRERRGPQDGAVSMATVNVGAMGAVSVTADTTPQGQGHATVMAQIVADQLGLTPDQIRVNTELDTHKDPWSIAAGTYSCRFTPGTAVATHLAAQQVRGKLARIASQTLNAPPEEVEFAGGKIFARNNPENALSFNRVAGSTHWTPSSMPDGVTGGLRETATWAPPELAPPDSGDRINTSLAYGFVFDYCGVEIDSDTGQVRIDKYVTMHDSGKRLNPRIVDGQIHGAFAQGLGAALLESFEYDDDGNFLSGTFADYLIPTATEVPEPVVLHMESPSPFTPLGAKGVGEGNCMTTPVCLANAVCDALDLADINLPLTPSKLSALLHGDEPPRP